MTEHPVGKIVVGVWLRSDAHLYSREHIGTRKVNYALDPVMASVAALSAYTQLARLKRNIVEHDDSTLRRNFIEAHCLCHRFAAVVHKGRGLHDKAALSGYHRVAGQRLEAQLLAVELVFFAKSVYCHESDVMAGAFVLRSWVAQTAYDVLDCTLRRRSSFRFEFFENICY